MNFQTNIHKSELKHNSTKSNFFLQTFVILLTIIHYYNTIINIKIIQKCGDNLKIERIEIIPLLSQLEHPYGNARGLVEGRTCTIVKLVTESGEIGYGEAFGTPLVIDNIIQDLKRFFIRKDLFSIPNTMSKVFNELYHTSAKGLLVCALSGIEMAAWDLFGKSLGLPAYNLLGGKVRDTLTPYASTGYMTATNNESDLKAQIEEVANRNFTAIKLKVGNNIKSDIQRVKMVRNHLPNIEIMVDMNGNYTADIAIRAINQLQEYDVYWFEEPLPPQDLLGYEKIKYACPEATIAVGEAEYTRYGFRGLIQNQLIDIVQPDLAKCGGITEAKAIVHMAQANNIRVSPHVWGGMVGQAAAIHFMMAIPFYPHSLEEPEPLYLEYDLGKNELREDIGETSVFRNHQGLIEVKDAPGYGVTLDEEKLVYYQIYKQKV